ncbi:hypothetical protein XENOCAPTIV_004990 [Xenoophorus captivus]|uniref:MHC class I antigen n=1 Tax=Xenoophorus captivus TaxID=1517983 RepID=A0ABV0RTK8_9TELE
MHKGSVSAVSCLSRGDGRPQHHGECLNDVKEMERCNHESEMASLSRPAALYQVSWLKHHRNQESVDYICVDMQISGTTFV